MIFDDIKKQRKPYNKRDKKKKKYNKNYDF